MKRLCFPLLILCFSCLAICGSATAAIRTWSGAVSGNWSDGGNWSPAGIPASGDVLTFPAGASHQTMTNDLPADFNVGGLSFQDSYQLSGNGLTLLGNLSVVGNTQQINTALKLGANCHFNVSAASSLNGAVDVNGHTLFLDSFITNMNGPINGSGSIGMADGNSATITGSGNFSGNLEGFALLLGGSLPNTTFSKVNSSWIALTGNGTVGVVAIPARPVGGQTNILRPGQDCCGYVLAAGVLHTKSLTIGDRYLVDLFPGAQSDSVQVTGSVTLSGSLEVSLPSGAPVPGQSFTIIDNDGSDPVNGTFSGLPERATISLGGQLLRISYQGGDGNDVVLSVLANTSAVLTQNASTTKVGEAWTLTDTVSSAFGIPTGSVSFSADGVVLGAAPLVNGVASLTTSLASTGQHNVIATFLGTGSFADNVAGSIGHTITRGQTVVDARPRTPLFIGQSPFITVFVTSGGSLAPTGAVSVSEGGAILGTQVLAGGAASFSLNPLAVGDHTLVVNYGGDLDFEASSETVIQSVILPAISIHGTHVIEGNHGVTIVSLVVSLSAPVSETVRVSFSTVAGSATEGEDYEKASGVIEFAPGELTHAIELHIFGDTFPESDETFSVLLSDPVNATIDTPSAVIVIVNDDQIPPRRRPSRH
jgi:fibronectin-binding autotransporter adhesin